MQQKNSLSKSIKRRRMVDEINFIEHLSININLFDSEIISKPINAVSQVLVNDSTNVDYDTRQFVSDNSNVEKNSCNDGLLCSSSIKFDTEQILNHLGQMNLKVRMMVVKVQNQL